MTTRGGEIFVIVGVGFACFSFACGERQCTRIRYPGDFQSGSRQQLASLGVVDGTEIEMCTLGQYRAGTVTVRGEPALLIFQDDTPLYFSSSMASDMFVDGQSIATVLSPRREGERNVFIYHARDQVSGARITVYDRDIDGQPDLRTRWYPDKRIESEVWIQGNWRSVVYRGNERGVVINGKFTPVNTTQEVQQAGESRKAAE
jgi:hypothetical protein